MHCLQKIFDFEDLRGLGLHLDQVIWTYIPLIVGCLKLVFLSEEQSFENLRNLCVNLILVIQAWILLLVEC